MISTLLLLELQHLPLQSVTHVRRSLALSCTIYFTNQKFQLMEHNRFFRSGPVSPHVQEKALDAKASSSNLGDTTTSQFENITASSLSSQGSLKRKVPDDGFDEDKVSTFFFVTLEFKSSHNKQEKLEYPHVSICELMFTISELPVGAEPCKHISQQTEQDSIVSI